MAGGPVRCLRDDPTDRARQPGALSLAMMQPRKKLARARRVGKDVAFGGRTAAQMAVAMVPVLGGAIGAGITALEMQGLTQRMEAMVGEVADAVRRVDEAKVDRDYIASPAFVDVVMAALDAGRRTSDRDKLKMIASILVGTATVDRPEELDVEAVLVAVRDLSPTALAMARRIHELAENPELSGLPHGRAIPPGGPDRDFLLNRLEAAGLIQRFGVSGFRLAGPAGQYSPTDTLTRILRLMQAGGWEPSV
jgi:hypothetical protein